MAATLAQITAALNRDSAYGRFFYPLCKCSPREDFMHISFRARPREPDIASKHACSTQFVDQGIMSHHEMGIHRGFEPGSSIKLEANFDK